MKGARVEGPVGQPPMARARAAFAAHRAGICQSFSTREPRAFGRSVLALVIVALLTAVPSSAQRVTNFAWWSNQALVKNLNLTQDQRERIRTIVRSYRNRLFDARNAVQKADADLEDMMSDSSVDPAAAKPIIERLANGRALATRLVTEMSVELRTVLTIDQWRQLVREWRETQKQRMNDTQVLP